MTLWRGFLEFRTCHHGKIVKYGLLEWCVELNEDVYVCNMETYKSVKKLEDTIPSVLKNNVGLNHYTCKSNFYYVENCYKQKQEVVVPCGLIEEFYMTLKEKLKTC
jgi:hypothetical protein